jgi:hypothetical protein
MNISVGKTQADRSRETISQCGGTFQRRKAAKSVFYLDSKFVVDIWAGVADPTAGRVWPGILAYGDSHLLHVVL